MPRRARVQFHSFGTGRAARASAPENYRNAQLKLTLVAADLLGAQVAPLMCTLLLARGWTRWRADVSGARSSRSDFGHCVLPAPCQQCCRCYCPAIVFPSAAPTADAVRGRAQCHAGFGRPQDRRAPRSSAGSTYLVETLVLTGCWGCARHIHDRDGGLVLGIGAADSQGRAVHPMYNRWLPSGRPIIPAHAKRAPATLLASCPLAMHGADPAPACLLACGQQSRARQPLSPGAGVPGRRTTIPPSPSPPPFGGLVRAPFPSTSGGVADSSRPLQAHPVASGRQRHRQPQHRQRRWDQRECGGDRGRVCRRLRPSPHLAVGWRWRPACAAALPTAPASPSR